MMCDMRFHISNEDSNKNWRLLWPDYEDSQVIWLTTAIRTIETCQSVVMCSSVFLSQCADSHSDESPSHWLITTPPHLHLNCGRLWEAHSVERAPASFKETPEPWDGLQRFSFLIFEEISNLCT